MSQCCLQKAAGYGSIRLVQIKGADSDWMGMTNKYGAAWEVPVTPKLPWDFRIVSDDGQEVRASECSTARALTMLIHDTTLPCLQALHVPD